jgi:ribosomal protein L14E/L6E/L27E
LILLLGKKFSNNFLAGIFCRHFKTLTLVQIRKLTCGHLNGVKQKIEISELADTSNVDTYLKRKKKEELKKLDGEQGRFLS